MKRRHIAATASMLGVTLALLLAPARASAEIPPPSPTPPNAPGTPLSGPGCPATGSWSELVLADGTRIHHISQVNVIAPGASPTPCPGYAVPTYQPTPPPTPAPPALVAHYEDDQLTYFGATGQLCPSCWRAFGSTSSTPKSGTGDHSASTAGLAYGWIFTGTRTDLLAAYAPYHGIASVRLDDGVAVDVDLYSAVRADQIVVWTSGALPDGVHRVVVKVTGRKNPASSDTIVSADRVDITGGILITPLAP